MKINGEKVEQAEAHETVKKFDETNEAVSALSTNATAHKTAIGSSGTEVFGGYFNEEYLPEIKGPKAQDIWDKMRRSEPQIAMLLGAIANSIISGCWELDPYDQKKPDSVKQRDLISKILFEGIDFEQTKKEAVSAFHAGFCLFEITHNVVENHPEFGTFNGLASLGFRSQKTIQSWKLEKKTGKIIQVEQWGNGDVAEHVNLPGEFLLVISIGREGDNYEGISLLRPMYGAWKRKSMFLKLCAIGVEKYAVGVPVGTVPATKENATDLAQFEEMLKSYTSHEKQYMIIGEGWKIELQKNDFDAQKITELLRFENTEMINAVIANFLALGQGGNGGAFALSNDLSDFFTNAIQTYADTICAAFNRKLIPDLVKMNFGPQEGYPRLKVTGISDKAGKELAEILKTLIDSKVVTPDDPLETSMRAKYKLGEADPKTARKVAPPAPFGKEPVIEGGNEPTPPKKVDAKPIDEDPSGEADEEESEDADSQTKKLSASSIALGGPGSGPQPGGGSKTESHNGVRIHQKSDGWHGVHPEGFSTGPFKDKERLKAHIDKFYTRPASPRAPAHVSMSEPKAPEYARMLEKQKQDLKDYMTVSLRGIAQDLVKQLGLIYNAAPTDNEKVIAPTQIEINPALLAQYKKGLQNFLGRQAFIALNQARTELGIDRRTLSEKFKTTLRIFFALPTAPIGAGYYEALPDKIKDMVTSKAILVGESQVADAKKIVTLQYSSSETGAEDFSQIQGEIMDSLDDTLAGSNKSGMSIDAAAGDAVAAVAAQARTSFFFAPEVFEEIESFTFENNDPVSVCCQFFADYNNGEGATWSPDDPAVDEFTPPLHHNCKSRMRANLKGVSDNPAISAPTDIPQDVKDAISL